MRIIGLYGHGGCGKSATMNFLKELLRAAGKSVSSKPHPHCDEPETFEYKGLIVCVAPGGDTGAIVQKNINYFIHKKCDVAFSASRCKGATADLLNNFAASLGVYVDWVSKSYEYNLCDATQRLCNEETAQFLFGKI